MSLSKIINEVRSGTLPGRMPTEAYRRAACLLFSDRVLDISDAEFDEMARALGLSEPVAPALPAPAPSILPALAAPQVASEGAA